MRHLHISISKQVLTAYENKAVAFVFSISSALNGTGCEQGSGKTPLGAHYIRAKIGQGEPVNSVFVGRRTTGEVYSAALASQFPNRDWILSRIMWLCGTELGVNRLGSVDSMARYIYIHGTPDSEPMGVAKSHGCIRMRNEDVIMLFDWVPKGCPVMIEE
ncbi:L,D-transpeptidase [Oceaniserpentilla sp. 4NH20-0058]|uniref:L,D-transpeptidase n=1 Tax=Oceaniserpentilla sp. 4NH20-0058 TaxID=3127660 RepID=UPI0033415963